MEITYVINEQYSMASSHDTIKNSLRELTPDGVIVNKPTYLIHKHVSKKIAMKIVEVQGLKRIKETN